MRCAWAIAAGPTAKEFFRLTGPGMQLFGAEELSEITEVLASRELCRYPFVSQNWSSPSKVDQFEMAVQDWTGATHCIAMNSCTSALLTGLWAAGVGPGDEIIVPGYTFVAPIAAIAYTGATPILAEIDETLTLDVDDVRRRITCRTRGILAVHALGAPCNIGALMELAQSHGINLFEDCAQAVGASYGGAALGTFGTFGAFSLNPFKTITTGEGGALLTNDADFYSRAYAIHDHGQCPGRRSGTSQPAALLGLNFRMHGLAGAIGLAQLRRLPGILRVLRQNKRRLADLIGALPRCTERPIHEPGCECATVLGYIFDDAALADAVACALGTDTLINTGKHYYGNVPELCQGHRAVAARVQQSSFSYPRRSLPRTDDILARTVLVSVGVVDAASGATRGIDIRATDEDIEAFSAEFSGIVRRASSLA